MESEINDTVDDFFPKIEPLFCAMVQESIDMMIAGEAGTPQVGEGSHAPNFTDEFRLIDFAGSTSLEIHNKVRAFYGARDIPKGALAKIDGQDICITRTFYRDGQEASSSPGVITSKIEDGKSFFVQCKDTTLEVLEWHKQE
jgi:methionyl-tRNA formyltransferase